MEKLFTVTYTVLHSENYKALLFNLLRAGSNDLKSLFLQGDCGFRSHPGAKSLQRMNG